MNEIYDVLIVGGGASGLMCANCLDKRLKTAIIDKQALGKKLLATGNGRCNLTNKNIAPEFYNSKLVKRFLEDFGLDRTINFFKSIGIELFFDDEGRAYPVSETAKDVQEALVKGLQGVSYIKDEVIEISKKSNYELKLLSNNIVKAKQVVLACGNGTLKNILKPLNLKYEDEGYILTGYKVKNFDKNLFGIRENAVVRADELNFKELGQVQFKKDGISGIVIFDLSAYANFKKVKNFEVRLELLPKMSQEELEKIIQYRVCNCQNLLKKDALIGLIKSQMADYIFKQAKLKDLNDKLSNLNHEEIKILVGTIKDLRFKCIEPYKDCQVLSGGVDLKYLKDLQAMDGLYFCGEATNVYGICGGFNLQWAWSSGFAVSKIINSKK